MVDSKVSVTVSSSSTAVNYAQSRILPLESIHTKGVIMKNKKSTNCETCTNYVYDEDYNCYTCMINLDEDEMARFLSGTNYNCPYYRLDDEYGVVRHQN